MYSLSSVPKWGPGPGQSPWTQTLLHLDPGCKLTGQEHVEVVGSEGQGTLGRRLLCPRRQPRTPRALLCSGPGLGSSPPHKAASGLLEPQWPPTLTHRAPPAHLRNPQMPTAAGKVKPQQPQAPPHPHRKQRLPRWPMFSPNQPGLTRPTAGDSHTRTRHEVDPCLWTAADAGICSFWGLLAGWRAWNAAHAHTP